jgi:hypothetical protein
MRRLICVGAVLVLLLASAACMATDGNGWRVGASWVRFNDSTLSDVLGDGWGLAAEYSMGGNMNMCAPKRDVSVFASYRKFSNDYQHESVQFEFWTAGLKLRFGQGARVQNRGLYFGGGIGLAYVMGDQQFGGAYDGDWLKLEWSGLAGVNLGESWYAEFAYVNAGDISVSSTGTWQLTAGMRF